MRTQFPGWRLNEDKMGMSLEEISKINNEMLEVFPVKSQFIGQ